MSTVANACQRATHLRPASGEPWMSTDGASGTISIETDMGKAKGRGKEMHERPFCPYKHNRSVVVVQIRLHKGIGCFRWSKNNAFKP